MVVLFHAAVNLDAFIPAAVGWTGSAWFLSAIVTWFVALVVAARFEHETWLHDPAWPRPTLRPRPHPPDEAGTATS